MKFAINANFGGYKLLDKKMNKLARNDPKLIEYLEAHKKDMKSIQATFSDIQIVEIPDTATDFYISDCDGFETLLYVVDEKILEAD